jgi:AraC family transcriptional regulator
VTFIAFDAGYETLEAFSRAFKAAFGVSPSGFRSRRRAPGPAPAPSRIHYSEARRLKDFKTLRSGGKTMQVAIKTLEPLRVAFLRHVGPYSDVGGTWDQLLATLGKDGWLGGDTMFLGICHDDPEVTPPGKIRYDACASVDERFVPAGDVGVQVVAGGEYAVTTHIGPYNEVGGTYAKLLGQWLPRSGRELRSSPCFEVYLNDPHGTEPEDLITDLYAPLEPRRGTGD